MGWAGECASIRPQLGVYVTGSIAPADRAVVVRHLTSCERCRDELAGLAALPAMLRRLPAQVAEQPRGGAAAPEPMATFTRSGLFTPFTPIFNADGQPGISLPLFEGEDGLPLAVQLVGRPAREGALLALAAQLEEAQPWAGRRAPLAAGVLD